MNFWTLAASQIRRQRAQLVLTWACLATAFLLFGLLLSVRQVLEAGSSAASSYRLRTSGASSSAQFMPISIAAKIAAVSGVRNVIYATATPAAFQNDPRHFLLQAVSQSGFLETFPELSVTQPARALWSTQKTALVAGPDLVARFGWQVGQEVALQTNVLNRDGSGAWSFQLIGTYTSADPKIPGDLAFVRYDYVNDSRVMDKDQAIAFISTLQDPAQASEVAGRIDLQFATSNPKVVTSPENESAQRQLAEFGDFASLIAMVAVGVFASMLVLASIVWHERATMRLRDFALLKVLGFPRRTVVMIVGLEILLVTLAAAGMGTASARLITVAFREQVQGVVQGFSFPAAGYGLVLLVAGSFALASGALACVIALRTPPLATLRGGNL